ncbi:hypothetical protein L484_025625 [Morus notabilis]|uniref:Uncharacterized protein n=1 Tax=Morus notabilis TaxID=981085 RepID=W9RJD7_9ROSA|nr:hypothetical protein L484_025625 [Morus notabilis]
MSPVSEKNVAILAIMLCKKQNITYGDVTNGDFEYNLDPVTRIEGDDDDDDDDDGGYDYAPAA